jgi:hypothetical protein
MCVSHQIELITPSHMNTNADACSMRQMRRSIICGDNSRRNSGHTTTSLGNDRDHDLDLDLCRRGSGRSLTTGGGQSAQCGARAVLTIVARR